MAHLSLSQTFLVLVPKPVVSLQPASPLSPPPQHLVGLQPAIILALSTTLAEFTLVLELTKERKRHTSTYSSIPMQTGLFLLINPNGWFKAEQYTLPAAQ